MQTQSLNGLDVTNQNGMAIGFVHREYRKEYTTIFDRKYMNRLEIAVYGVILR